MNGHRTRGAPVAALSLPREALAVATAALLLVCTLALGGCGDGGKDAPRLIPHAVGYEGTLVSSVPIMASKDKQGLDPLSRPLGGAGAQVVLSGGTRVRVVQADADAAQVEVLGGMQAGQRAWVAWSVLP